MVVVVMVLVGVTFVCVLLLSAVVTLLLLLPVVAVINMRCEFLETIGTFLNVVIFVHNDNQKYLNMPKKNTKIFENKKALCMLYNTYYV